MLHRVRTYSSSFSSLSAETTTFVDWSSRIVISGYLKLRICMTITTMIVVSLVVHMLKAIFFQPTRIDIHDRWFKFNRVIVPTSHFLPASLFSKASVVCLLYIIAIQHSCSNTKDFGCLSWGSYWNFCSIAGPGPFRSTELFDGSCLLNCQNLTSYARLTLYTTKSLKCLCVCVFFLAWNSSNLLEVPASSFA